MPKRLVDVKSLARVHTESAVKVLQSIMSEPSAPANCRVHAAEVLLNRGWGKPTQPISGEDGNPIKIQAIAWLDQMGDNAKLVKQVEHRPAETLVLLERKAMECSELPDQVGKNGSDNNGSVIAERELVAPARINTVDIQFKDMVRRTDND